jgi:Tol biopolymer transport system component
MRRLGLLAALCLLAAGSAHATSCECIGGGVDDPGWLPDGSLVYTADGTRDVTVRSPAGSTRRLTHEGIVSSVGGSFDRYATPSPEGRTIAYLGAGALKLVAVAGGAPRIVVRVAEQRPISFSPDGAWIAYTRDGVRIVGVDGRGDRALVAGTSAAWSPDGGLIAFAADGQLAVIRPDGAGRQAIGPGASAAWSSDGARLAFQNGDSIWVWERASGGEHAVTVGSSPRWLPDRRTLVYAGPQRDLRLVDANGGESRTLLGTAQDERQPVPSPDGKTIAYIVANVLAQSQGFTAGNSSDLYTVAIDGTGRRSITGTCHVGPKTDPSALCLNIGWRPQSIPASLVDATTWWSLSAARGSTADRTVSGRVRGFVFDGHGRRVRDATVTARLRGSPPAAGTTRNDGFWSATIKRAHVQRKGTLTIVLMVAHRGGVTRTRLSAPARYFR